MIEIKRDILVIDILLKIAEIEDKKAKIVENNKSLALKDQELKSKTAESERTKTYLASEQESLQAIRIDISNNECSKLISKLNQDLQLLEKDKEFVASHVEVLQAQLEKAIRALKFVPSESEDINALVLRNLGKTNMSQAERDEIFVILNTLYKRANSELNAEKAEKNLKVATLKEELSEHKKKIDNLRKNRITYPKNTISLKEAIESEFDSCSISADVRVFADLLEIVKPEWQNAVEGYLNTQRFNIIVESQYYDVAAEVYDRMKHQIEGVTLVNTQALDLKSETDETTLASVVSSKNRYARAYANYLMGRVVLCDEVIKLKQYPIAITDSAHGRKQGLYEMITSEVNMGGFTLFASEFEERYHSEMEDLFSKLTESDEHGDKILSEYTDYREYMDYDIEIVSKDGKSQFFSKIYGEKSGGETQTPYYVAIAASFAQMYSVGETIRIIMLDEAFDKMDDDRIASMMQFFRSQNFQIILATPPAKIETIGEYVDTILVTYRNGYSSIVEEYNL